MKKRRHSEEQIIAEVVEELRRMKITPQVTQKERSALDSRTTWPVGYPISHGFASGWKKFLGG